VEVVAQYLMDDIAPARYSATAAEAAAVTAAVIPAAVIPAAVIPVAAKPRGKAA
jgi:hypothetical protein